MCFQFCNQTCGGSIGSKHERTFGHKAGGHNLIPMSIQVGLGMRLSDHFQSGRTNLQKLCIWLFLFVRLSFPWRMLCEIFSRCQFRWIEQALHAISMGGSSIWQQVCFCNTAYIMHDMHMYTLKKRYPSTQSVCIKVSHSGEIVRSSSFL